MASPAPVVRDYPESAVVIAGGTSGVGLASALLPLGTASIDGGDDVVGLREDCGGNALRASRLLPDAEFAQPTRQRILTGTGQSAGRKDDP